MLLKLTQYPLRNQLIDITFALPSADRRMHLDSGQRQYGKTMMVGTGGEPQ